MGNFSVAQASSLCGQWASSPLHAKPQSGNIKPEPPRLLVGLEKQA